jgi:hypothetical protein
MNAPRYARNKTEAARLAGMSRTRLYQILQLPGAPLPRADGRWSVAAIRKFASKEANKIEVPTERDRLETELLKKRIAKVDLEISQLDGSRREQITETITGECKRVIDTLQSALHRMPDELSGVFAMLAEPLPIYRRFREEMRRRFEAAYEGLKKIEKQSQRKSNVVRFEREAITSNGAKS